jgi:phosphoribosylamine--glycine ligase
MSEKIALVGNGGREDALAKHLSEHAEIVSLPGNPGMAELGECFAVDLSNPEEIARIAKREAVDLVVVGPEVPLVAGAVDALEKAGIPAFGPNAEAAMLEGSKAFMKDIATVSGVPTADYHIFYPGEERDALRFYGVFPRGAVIKADGLAAGKGVTLPKNRKEAWHTINEYLSGRAFGEAGQKIVVEERLEGREVSLMALCDGLRAIPFDPARDHKRLLDGDEGPNTGGMGAFSPVDDVPPELVADLMDIGVNPILHYMNERRTPFRGIFYAGFMLTESGPKLLEINTRFGDPETQAVIPRLKSSLVDHLWESAAGSLRTPVEFSDDAAVTVTLAAPGYPEQPQTGDPIEGIEDAKAVENAQVFHAGTAIENDGLVTAGGRVLYVTGIGERQMDARRTAYEAANKIHWPGLQKRFDIAEEA